ncbi:MAG: hypothetical protein JSS83_27565 [Cyanobacteria bacterium SZAS LIN-3]|nr:hypothetical protein [Cyanobacteria bacterium SZAS LIN-3]
MATKKTALILTLIVFSLVSAWAAFAYITAARLNACVSLVSKGKEMEAFLAKPSISFVETYFRFEDSLKDDVIFGVDQESIEGVEHPVYIKGGDWMAIIGLQRTGAVWVACGTEATQKGIPSKDRTWKILTTGQAFQPGVWYHIKCYADYSTRHFRNLEIDGPGLKKSFDLSACTVDYPNYMPFDKRAMSYYAYSMRSRTMMKERGKPLVYFDDLRGGVIEGGRECVVFQTDFENQSKIGEQPVTLPVIKLDNYTQGKLYLERPESRFRIETSATAHSGTHVGVSDSDLD